ncbi:Gfo/Idh/MocA family protein [Guptibacillus sedimenti]|uniref:Gfo/Idh/MocA family protein n=1 Tax=Guptibacillus sedimenti TaxID=3025680 RepID=UPI002361C5BB|nr:Gfo/Idh/MocA family oxidoreductase [Pseudalkalibacillus sedimenti]
MTNLSIGMIGLDTSHAIAFTKLLNNPHEKHHVKGGKVEVAFPGGSSHSLLSKERVDKYKEEVQEYGVKIVNSIEAVAEESDAIMLLSMDGSLHLEQLRKIIPFRKPVFIDKPFSLNSIEALHMKDLAGSDQVPIMSSSALRFADNLQEALVLQDKGEIIGADCYGPLEFIREQPGYFWYGIHAVEMLYSILGTGAHAVEVLATDRHHLLTGKWKDGRIGTVRGNLSGNYEFGAVIHFEKGSVHINASNNKKTYYASLLERVIAFFLNGKPHVSIEETLEIIRFIELSNQSKPTVVDAAE